jgi:parvulin-like peptidyl-prolyl isomerase
VKRALVLVLCCCALGVGCADTSHSPAATANGSTVTTKDLRDELNAINANHEYLTSIDNALKQQGQAVVGTAPGTFDAGFVSQLLLRQLQFAVIHDEVQRRNLTANDECKKAAQDDLVLTMGQNDVQAGQATLAGFTDDYRNQLESWFLDEYLLQADLTNQPCGSDSVARAYFDAHPQDFTQNCVSVITVADENLANSIVEQSRAGADFAALAKQYSTDAQTASSGGDAGCHYPDEFPSTLAPTVEGTQVGGVTDPISDNVGGFAIIKVDDRKPAAYADVSSEAQQLAARDQSVELGSWLQHTLASAKVTVDPRFGTFDAQNGVINPPPGDKNSSSTSSGSEAPPAATP